jgi:hypothetical protein
MNQLVHQHLVDLPVEERLARLASGLCDDVEPTLQRSVEAGDRIGLEIEERLPEVRIRREQAEGLLDPLVRSSKLRCVDPPEGLREKRLDPPAGHQPGLDRLEKEQAPGPLGASFERAESLRRQERRGARDAGERGDERPESQAANRVPPSPTPHDATLAFAPDTSGRQLPLIRVGRKPRSDSADRPRLVARVAAGGGRPGRRRFDNLHTELSVELGVLLSRFDLWLELHERNMDPERLTREEAISFCGAPLASYLHRRGLSLRPRALRRLCRKVGKYDPAIATPYERFAALP